MKCPLKFSRYEFEGGEECIGADCGFFGSVCDMDMSVSVQKCPNVATNGIDGETNGIAADSPLVEGDAVAIMRKVSDNMHAVDYARLTLEATDTSDMFAKLADMVERDYVRRDDYDFVVDALKYMKAEHDEWKAKAEEAERAMNAAAGKWAKADEENRELRKMLLFDDGTVEEYTERADPMTALTYQKQLAEEWRDRCHNAEAWCDKLESERDELTNAINELQKKQPYCYDPEAPLDTLRTVGRYIDELQAERDELKKELSIANAKLVGKPECEICDRATLLVEIEKLRDERDEWKAKVKTLAGYSNYWRGRCAKLEYRSDKRAAAVERVRKAKDAGTSIGYAIVGREYYPWEAYETLIDLLTDDDTHSTTGNMTEQSESSSDETDSYEKLEADVSKWCLSHAYGDTGYTFIIKQLDRQAAITERETRLRELYRFEENHRASIDKTEEVNRKLNSRIAELQAKMDELTEQLEAAYAKNRSLKLHISKMQSGRHGWHVKGVELQRQVDELAAQLHASNAERERLRECLGIATDNAHDFLTLVDESGNVSDRDEGLA